MLTITFALDSRNTHDCGQCLRDNALALALRARGHDVTMIPLYLPLLTDEASALDDTPIFFGGINCYLEQKFAFFRNTPLWIDRLFNSPALLRASAKLAGMTTAKDLGELALSMLHGEDGRQAKELERLIDWWKSLPAPDVICLSNCLLSGLARRLKQSLRAPVVCTLQGEDAFLDSLPEPYRQQAWSALTERAADVDLFIGVSRYYGDVMRRRLGLSPDRVAVVHNGITLDGFAPAPAPPNPPALGFLARLHHGKGLGTLVDAFIELRKRNRVRDLKLRIAGATMSLDEPFVHSLQERLASHGLGDQAEWLPNIDRHQKQDFLRSLSVLSVPATYGESFGLYVLEALASGVPVVQPRHAAFPELLEKTGGGILVEPDNVTALADGIEQLLLDPARARRLGQQGREAVVKHFSVEQMARNVEDVLIQVTKGSRKPDGIRV